MRDDSGVSSAEVHVADGRPGSRVRTEDFNALTDEGTVMAADRIEKSSENSYASSRSSCAHVRYPGPGLKKCKILMPVKLKIEN